MNDGSRARALVLWAVLGVTLVAPVTAGAAICNAAVAGGSSLTGTLIPRLVISSDMSGDCLVDAGDIGAADPAAPQIGNGHDDDSATAASAAGDNGFTFFPATALMLGTGFVALGLMPRRDKPKSCCSL
jgi:hypothetical protein